MKYLVWFNISPTLQIEFFKKLGLRTPAWLQIKGRS